MHRQICHRFIVKNLTLAILSAIIAVAAGGCSKNCASEAGEESGQDMVRMVFHLELNSRVYEDSTWGDPPQIAIWLQSETDKSIRTVMVTYRTGACDWLGKVECSVALPYWVSFYNKQTGTKGPPTWDNPAPEAITCATPKATLITDTEAVRGSRWKYFIEINVSGDFNPDFPSLSKDGISDRYGNGQPSLVYQGLIEATEGAASKPELLGRTDQYEPIDYIISNVEKITTAKNLLKEVSVLCSKK
jgi:hypothetical protein